jgi:hypothetical protein
VYNVDETALTRFYKNPEKFCGGMESGRFGQFGMQRQEPLQQQHFDLSALLAGMHLLRPYTKR